MQITPALALANDIGPLTVFLRFRWYNTSLAWAHIPFISREDQEFIEGFRYIGKISKIKIFIKSHFPLGVLGRFIKTYQHILSGIVD